MRNLRAECEEPPSVPSTKARRFSRQHNRNVKQESSSSEDDDGETPKPFHQLLAEKAQVSLGLTSLPTSHCQ